MWLRHVSSSPRGSSGVVRRLGHTPRVSLRRAGITRDVSGECQPQRRPRPSTDVTIVFISLRTAIDTSTLSVIGAIDLIGWAILAGSLAGGIGTLGLIWYLDRHRGAPGAKWFMTTLGAQAIWVFAYTTGLVVAAPFWRATAEALAWVGLVWLGPLFLAFALTYTGRSNVVYSRWFLLVFVVPVVTTVLAGTHPAHSLLWQGFQPASVFGLVTAQYTIQPLSYVAAVFSLSTAGVGVFLLVGAVISYGPLYRREAIAVALSTVPPAGGVVLWLSGFGPWPSLNLASVLFLPHVFLDAYAFVGTHMFDTNPTTQRAAERGALSNLDDPLLVVDPGGRVVNMSERARQLFDADAVTLPVLVGDLVGSDFETLRAEGEYKPGRRDEVYAVSHTPLSEPSGSDVGAILVFYDITTIRRQKQRLSVLNRILRHNLRNQLNVTRGRAELIEAETDDPSVRTHATAIQRSNAKLLSIGDRIREFQRIQDTDRTMSPADPVALVERVTAGISAEYPEATLNVEVDVDERRLETDEDLLSLVVTNLLENAIVHSEAETPVAAIELSDTADDTMVFEVRDSNERIPEIEIETLDAAEESALQHGKGIGLWIATWCLEFLDGEFTFEYEDGNVVTVRLPRTGPSLSSA